MDLHLQSRALSAAEGAEPAILAIVDRLCGELRPDAVRSTLDASLERDLGLDSLARVELVLRTRWSCRARHGVGPHPAM